MRRISYNKILSTLLQFGQEKFARTLSLSVKHQHVFESTFDDDESSKNVDDVLGSTVRRLGDGHNVYVVQPDIVGMFIVWYSILASTAILHICKFYLFQESVEFANEF